ncbi:unnamed protein product [Rangifer tarandus platyrhynchus]|uniref:Uncharacterized protein n=1 Tax=Rangifer tarandus platyrhynchus TaxID=3082113 RepID=A0AC59Z4I5_RANTA
MHAWKVDVAAVSNPKSLVDPGDPEEDSSSRELSPLHAKQCGAAHCPYHPVKPSNVDQMERRILTDLLALPENPTHVGLSSSPAPARPSRET